MSKYFYEKYAGDYDIFRDNKLGYICSVVDMEEDADDLIAILNEQDQKIAELSKALELAVKDKCEFENKFFSSVFGVGDGKLSVPKKEQWYLEKAKEELNNDR